MVDDKVVYNFAREAIKPKKLEAFDDLIERYLEDRDKYNERAVYDGLFKALDVFAKDRPLIEVVRAIDKGISGFQLNWVMNTLSEYAVRGKEIEDVWQKYQKSIEPKKTSRRSKCEVPDPDEF